MTGKESKSDYLFVDDITGTGELMPPEVLLSIPPEKSKVIGVMLGPFSIKEFEKLKMPKMNILTKEVR